VNVPFIRLIQNGVITRLNWLEHWLDLGTCIIQPVFGLGIGIVKNILKKIKLPDTGKFYDTGYVAGARNERERILVLMGSMIDNHIGPESWSLLLRQFRDSLANHKPN
jgi:hypothetical protein